MGMLSLVCNATGLFRNFQLQFTRPVFGTSSPLAGDIGVDEPILPITQDDFDAKLVGGIILLFAHDVTDANRKAATNSVLFAQSVASRRLSQEQCKNAAQ